MLHAVSSSTRHHCVNHHKPRATALCTHSNHSTQCSHTCGTHASIDGIVEQSTTAACSQSASHIKNDKHLQLCPVTHSGKGRTSCQCEVDKQGYKLTVHNLQLLLTDRAVAPAAENAGGPSSGCQKPSCYGCRSAAALVATQACHQGSARRQAQLQTQQQVNVSSEYDYCSSICGTGTGHLLLLLK